MLAKVIIREQGRLCVCVEDVLVQEERVTGGDNCCPSDRTVTILAQARAKVRTG